MEDEYYLCLNKNEVNMLRKIVRFDLQNTKMRPQEWETLMGLYESLLGARFNLSSVREIDAAVKKTRIYKALYNLAYFDYEEDNNDSTFYDLVCFLDDSGFEVFEEIAQELKNDEQKVQKQTN